MIRRKFTSQVADSVLAAFCSSSNLSLECSGILNSDFWNDIKWYTDNVWVHPLQKPSAPIADGRFTA